MNTSNDEYTCQPHEVDTFSARNIRKCEEEVCSMQRKLDKAVANDDIDNIRRYFDFLTKRSHAVKVLAVWKITQRNDGRYTAGVDKIAIPKGEDKETQNRLRYKLLNDIDIMKSPDPIRRTYIPKSNGKLRPLGIPTLADRIVQEILRIALEPIVEYHFDSSSYGFRPKRSCQDAMSHLYNKLAKRTSRRYVVEGDIKGCFDNINHNHIINTLLQWQVPKWATETIRKMLKAKIFYNGEICDSETGTPQGGVISPLLANVALTTLDEFCKERFGWKVWSKEKGYYQSNPIVRYADDFVIVCKSEPEAEIIKKEIATHLKDTVGLTLSEEKTRITHITKGFNFLGFNFRKYKSEGKQRSSEKKDYKPTGTKWDDYQLLIKPQSEKVHKLLQNCKETLDTQKTAPQHVVIRLLNQKLFGWGMYYRHVVSKRTFLDIDHEIWWKLYRWSKRRHPNKTKGWIVDRYFHRKEGRKRLFMDKETNNEIVQLGKIPIKRFVMVKEGYRVHDGNKETVEYWQKREYINAYSQIESVRMKKLFNKQKGKCPYCNSEIKQEQIINTELHTHHMNPRSFGGNEKLSNLKLIHSECHREIHAIFSRKEMSYLFNKEIDYLRLKPE